MANNIQPRNGWTTNRADLPGRPLPACPALLRYLADLADEAEDELVEAWSDCEEQPAARAWLAARGWTGLDYLGGDGEGGALLRGGWLLRRGAHGWEVEAAHDLRRSGGAAVSWAPVRELGDIALPEPLASCLGERDPAELRLLDALGAELGRCDELLRVTCAGGAWEAGTEDADIWVEDAAPGAMDELLLALGDDLRDAWAGPARELGDYLAGLYAAARRDARRRYAWDGQLLDDLERLDDEAALAELAALRAALAALPGGTAEDADGELAHWVADCYDEPVAAELRHELRGSCPGLRREAEERGERTRHAPALAWALELVSCPPRWLGEQVERLRAAWGAAAVAAAVALVAEGRTA